MNKLVSVLKDVFRSSFTEQEFHSFLDLFDKNVYERFGELNLYHVKQLNHSEFRHRIYNLKMYVFADRDKNNKIKQIKLTVHWHYDDSGHHYYREQLWNFVSRLDAVNIILDEFQEGLEIRNLVTVRQAYGCKKCGILEFDSSGNDQHIYYKKDHMFIPSSVEDGVLGSI